MGHVTLRQRQAGNLVARSIARWGREGGSNREGREYTRRTREKEGRARAASNEPPQKITSFQS